MSRSPASGFRAKNPKQVLVSSGSLWNRYQISESALADIGSSEVFGPAEQL